MRTVVIGENDAGQRLDKFLKKAFPDLPQSLIYRGLRIKRIKLSGKRAAPEYKLKCGERIELYINDEFLEAPDTALRPQFMYAGVKLSVVYEDINIAILFKEAGLLCHEDENEHRDTLINRFLRHLYSKGEYDPTAEQSFTPALCNRIDRNTEGLVIAAKNAAALREAGEIIKNRIVSKEYLLAVVGAPPNSHGLLTGYHTKDERDNTVKITPYKREGAKTAITGYRLLTSSRGLSLLLVTLHTGRTHQIRAHMAALGCPIVGDLKYGRAADMPDDRRRQALSAAAIKFLPDCGEYETLGYLSGRSFFAPPPSFLGQYFPGYSVNNSEFFMAEKGTGHVERI